MDNLVWGIPFLLFFLMCPLMMVGMAVFMWLAARLGLRRISAGAASADAGHSGHMMCGPMMMGHGDHASHQPSSEGEVSALRHRVEGLERRLSESRSTGPAH